MVATCARRASRHGPDAPPAGFSRQTAARGRQRRNFQALFCRTRGSRAATRATAALRRFHPWQPTNGWLGFGP
jgi:hypothetical protein